MVAVNVKIIEELKCFLTLISSTSELKEICFERREDFTRRRKLGFSETVFLMINMIKRSLKIEIQDFLEYGLEQKLDYTKMAFILQRKKIKPIVFEAWNQLVVDCFYHYYGSRVKRWNGFLLIGIDGSTAYLPNNPETESHYGVQINQHRAIPMARIMKFYDVLNNITIFSKIAPLNNSEQTIVSDHIEQIPADSISIYDRGFPSYSLMYLLNNQESVRHFVMRAKLDFNLEVKEFVSSNKDDTTLNLYATKKAIDTLKLYGYSVSKNTAIKIRMIKVVLDSGETEVLLTNLYDQNKFKISCFKQLYFSRWGIETSIAFDKNITQLEEFSGQSVKSIEQDFQIATFVLNLQSLLEKQCEQLLKRKNQGRELVYKVNKNVSVGSMKYRIVKLFTEKNPRKILRELQQLFLQSIEPIRPGRSAPREFRIIKRKGKHKTLNNYKRAI